MPDVIDDALGRGLQGDQPLTDELIAEIVLNAALDLLTASQLRRAVLLFGEALQPSHHDDGDSMDGDHDSAMASAGWGTDEDYGGGSERL
jgi:hypothetical protein